MGNATAYRLFKILLFLVGVILTGTAGYILLEGWSVLDGFYMTVITLSTVGYGEPESLSSEGRWFTAFLIFFCIIGMTFWTAFLTSFVVENDLSGNFLRRRHLRMIGKLNGHTIVCGGGLMGQAIIEQLLQKQKPVVLVEHDEQCIAELRQRFPKLLTVQGSATNELILAKAGIVRAKYVVAATDSEIDNLLVVITCKDMGPELEVYARCNDATISNRMRKAQADEVLSPSRITGQRIADLITS